MRLSRLLALSFLCCTLAGCSDSSSHSDDSQDPSESKECKGDDCSKTKPEQGKTSSKPDPDKEDPTKEDPPKTNPDDKEKTCGSDIDLMTDDKNCGSCGHKCENATCTDGKCVCSEGFMDCTKTGQCTPVKDCECELGQKEECYDGQPAETAGVGICKKGYTECLADDNGTYWDSTCKDQIVPIQNIADFICDAADPLRDNDCNGIPDTEQDEDKDGHPICKDGKIDDCCDNKDMCKTENPELIHSGVETDCKGNNIDDNCNGTVDESEISCNEVPPPCQGEECGTEVCKYSYGDCDQGLVWNNSNDAESAHLLAQSMDICMTNTSDPTKGALLEYSVHRSGHNDKPVNSAQINILNGMKDAQGKTLIPPRLGHSFALLSTGQAKDVSQGVSTQDIRYSETKLDPAVSEFFGVSVEDDVPDFYLKAHNNQLNASSKCSVIGTFIADSVVLHLKLQAPAEAKGFSFDFRFFSREYPHYVCSTYNDFFLAILTDEKGNPIGSSDGNIAFDKEGNPITINSAFFTTCHGCESFDELFAYYPKPYQGTGDSSSDYRGGATAWLTTNASIQGGQIFNLDLYIWDTHDQTKDSTVILDNFRWLCDATQGTEFAKPIENPIQIN